MGSSCLGTLGRTPLTQSYPQVLGPSLQGREWTLMDLDMELSLVRWGWGGWRGWVLRVAQPSPLVHHCSPSAKAPAPFPSCFLGFSSAVAALGSREG